MKLKDRVRRFANWMHRRSRARGQVPTDLSEAIRENIGPRVVEGPAGLHSSLYDITTKKSDDHT